MAGLPPLATLDQLVARMPGGIAAGAELARAAAVLDDVSALARLTSGVTWVDESGAITAPEAAVAIVVAATIRTLRNPLGLASQTVGDASWTAGAKPELTEEEKATLRRLAGKSGLWTLGTTRGVEDLVFLTDQYEGDPIPYDTVGCYDDPLYRP